MSRFLLLYGSEAESAGPLDPATLSPVEHYKETGWSAGPDWTDSIGSTAAFASHSGTITSTTQNSLTVYETASGRILSETTPKSIASWTDSETAITLYIVARWDGTIGQTVIYFGGNQINELFRMKSNTGDELYIQHQETGGEDLILNPAMTMTSGWQIWAVRIANVTGAGVMDFFSKQGAAVNVANASWVATDMLGNNYLFNNNTSTEPWDGALAEVILFTDAHDDATIGRVNAFLADKWGIV